MNLRSLDIAGLPAASRDLIRKWYQVFGVVAGEKHDDADVIRPRAPSSSSPCVVEAERLC